MKNDNPQDTNAAIDPEQEQLLRMDHLRRLVQLLLRRHLSLFLGLFAFLLLAQCAFLAYRDAKSPRRYAAELKLLFQPKDSEYIRPIDDNAMLQLFSRSIIRERANEELQKAGCDPIAPGQVRISQDRSHFHLFTITTGGNTGEEAAIRANIFAKVCKEEYRNFRLADLDSWTGIARQQHQDLQAKIRDTSEQIVALGSQLGLADLESEQSRLVRLIGEQEQALFDLNVRLADAADAKARLAIAIKAANPRALRHAAKLRTLLRTIHDLDSDLLAAEPLYTENNPKLQALRAQRQAAQKAYDDFLAAEEISDFNPDSLDAAERLRERLEKTLATESTIASSIRVLKAEIDRNHQLLERIIGILPRLNQLKLLQDANLRALETSENRLTDLDYLKNASGNELQPIEQASHAVRISAFNKKTVSAMLFLAVFLTAGGAVAVLLAQLGVGRLRNYAELECYYGLTPVGILPGPPGSYAGDNRRGKFALSAVYYKFFQLRPDCRRLFIGCPDNSAASDSLGDALARQFAANGRRLLLIKIVPSRDFMEPHNSTQLNAVFHSGGRGFLPVETTRALTGAEINLLGEDLKLLEESYDVIIVLRTSDMTRHSILFQQMSGLCDTSMLLAEPRKTRRSTLRFLIGVHQKAGRKLYAVMLGDDDRQDTVA